MDSFEKDNFVSVLTASFGDGHNTAAKNIVTALNDLKIPNSGALDLLNTIHPSIMQCLTKGYRIITTRYPSIWKQLYRIADNISFGDESFDLMPTVTRGTAAYLQKTKPKTKNGKLVELAVKQTVEGETIKNLEALANPGSLNQFKNIKELNE